MGADQPRWYSIGSRKPRHSEDPSRAGQDQATDRSQGELPRNTKDYRPAAERDSALAVECDGALVARSQIRITGSIATLHGTMTNETTCDVHFSGMPPYAKTIETDGNRPVLRGDFNSPPREQPSCADWVMHPGASVPYQSLPVTLEISDPRWDGADWCTSSQSTTLDMRTFGNERRLPNIHLFS